MCVCVGVQCVCVCVLVYILLSDKYAKFNFFSNLKFFLIFSYELNIRNADIFNLFIYKRFIQIQNTY